MPPIGYMKVGRDARPIVKNGKALTHRQQQDKNDARTKKRKLDRDALGYDEDDEDEDDKSQLAVVDKQAEEAKEGSDDHAGDELQDDPDLARMGVDECNSWSRCQPNGYAIIRTTWQDPDARGDDEDSEVCGISVNKICEVDNEAKTYTYKPMECTQPQHHPSCMKAKWWIKPGTKTSEELGRHADETVLSYFATLTKAGNLRAEQVTACEEIVWGSSNEGSNRKRG